MIAAPGEASSGAGSGHVVEIVLAGLLFLGGLRSLVKWFRTDFDADSRGERVLYAIFASARVGMWFALGGLFLGYGVLSEPQGIQLFALVPLGLAGLQLLTGMVLARRGSPAPRREGVGPAGVDGRPTGKAPAMAVSRTPSGPLEPEKHGETADPGHPQPEAAEVESARLLGNDARDELRASGLTDGQIRQLADEYIALDRGEGLAEFIRWAKARAAQGGRRSTG